MALKATIYKAEVEIADMDRNVYTDHSITIARHPSETDERMMIRLLAFGLNAPPDNDQGALEFAKDMWNADEPSLWQKSLIGELKHWIEVGQPDDKRLMRVTARTEHVSVYSFSSSTMTWWKGIADKLTRARNLSVWQIPAEQSESLATLAQRTMRLHLSIQDGAVWVTEGERSIEVTPIRLYGTAAD